VTDVLLLFRWVTAKVAIAAPPSGWLERAMYKAIRRPDSIDATSAGWKSDILLCNGYLPISGALMIADFTNRKVLKIAD
jgi:hypothetical protein